jgi:hypothetical protein
MREKTTRRIKMGVVRGRERKRLWNQRRKRRTKTDRGRERREKGRSKQAEQSYGSILGEENLHGTQIAF